MLWESALQLHEAIATGRYDVVQLAAGNDSTESSAHLSLSAELQLKVNEFAPDPLEFPCSPPCTHPSSSQWSRLPYTDIARSYEKQQANQRNPLPLMPHW